MLHLYYVFVTSILKHDVVLLIYLNDLGCVHITFVSLASSLITTVS